MTLPEIPDEAITEAGFEMGHCEPYAEAALTAAWPHLYAAALRHAMENPGIDVACHDLLRCMAEAATE